jgi:predicted DNA-binding protein with PD1-like motif
MVVIPEKLGTKTMMVSFRRGELVLEKLTEYLKEKNIDAGLIISGIGSFDICNLHYIEGTDLPPKDVIVSLNGPIEIGSLQGSIAGGSPHIHMVVYDASTGKNYCGHLEPGSRCCYRVELGIIALPGVKTMRKTDPSTQLVDIVNAE